jgi:hypothetical protein
MCTMKLWVEVGEGVETERNEEKNENKSREQSEIFALNTHLNIYIYIVWTKFKHPNKSVSRF